MHLYTIYINIIDGSEAYIPCHAILLSDNTYKIENIESFDLEDDTCIWSYFPGDVVECSFKKLDSGNVLVAHKLLDYTHPNRMLYKLVYDIISENLASNINYYGNAINTICDKEFGYGKKYPTIQEWIKEHCE